MGVTLGTYLALPDEVSVTLDGTQAVIDPGDASVVRVTGVVGTPTLVGILGGVEGRWLQVLNDSAGSFDLEQFSPETAEANRIAAESGPFSVGANGQLWLLYAFGMWRNIE
jgi:hypothetical protein